MTCTFGGVAITLNPATLDTSDEPIGGLFTAGNASDRFFYAKYLRWTGLTRAAMSGRIAAERAPEAIDERSG